MNNNERFSEFKIGLFVLIGIGLLVFALLRLDVLTTKPQQEIKAHFLFTGGLESGAAVQMAGVPIGEVKALKIVRLANGRTGVEVVFGIQTDVTVPADSEITISTHGLLGTKYIEILPGSADALPAGGVYTGRNPVQIDAMLAAGERMALKMERTVDLVNRLVEDGDFQTTLKTNGQNVSSLILELRQAASSLNEILDGMKSGKGLIGKMLTDETVYQDVKDTVADVKRHPWKLWKKN